MPKKSRLPRMEPVRPKVRDITRTPFVDIREWTFELKYDGYRGVLHIEERPHTVSKQMKPLPRFDALSEAIKAELKVENAVLDGEVVVFDTGGRPHLKNLMRHLGKPVYVAFDLLWLNGEDLRELPLIERRKRLKKIVPKKSKAILLPVHVDGRGDTLFKEVCRLDLEGMIAKRLLDPYRTLSTRWYKILNPLYTSKVVKKKRKSGV